MNLKPINLKPINLKPINLKKADAFRALLYRFDLKFPVRTRGKNGECSNKISINLKNSKIKPV